MSEWISINDQMPAIHEEVLVTDGTKIMIDYLTTQDSWHGNENELGFRTHWMPLPYDPLYGDKKREPDGFFEGIPIDCDF